MDHNSIKFLICIFCATLANGILADDKFAPLSLIFKKHDVNDVEPMVNTTFRITKRTSEEVPKILQCDDVSDSNGKAMCRFKCDPDDAFSKSFILWPKYYSDYNIRQKYFIKLKGCALSPNKLIVEYTHWRIYVKNTETKYLALVNSNSKLKTIAEFSPESAETKKAFSELAKEDEGVDLILKARKHWSNLAVANHKLGNEQKAALYSNYSVLAANIMLHKLTEEYANTSVNSVKISPKLSTYYNNLDNALTAIKTEENENINVQTQQRIVETLSKVKEKRKLNELQFKDIETMVKNPLGGRF